MMSYKFFIRQELSQLPPCLLSPTAILLSQVMLY